MVRKRRKVPVAIAVDEREAQHCPCQTALAQRLLRRDLAGGIGLRGIDRIILAARSRLILAIDVAGAGEDETGARRMIANGRDQGAGTIQVALPDQRVILRTEDRRKVDDGRHAGQRGRKRRGIEQVAFDGPRVIGDRFSVTHKGPAVMPRRQQAR